MKYAFRRFFKTPAFALTAIITVGAAIGANALIFSVVNGVILKPLPYADPPSLVGMWHVAPGVMPGPLQQSAGTYFMEREAGQSFTDVGWTVGGGIEYAFWNAWSAKIEYAYMDFGTETVTIVNNVFGPSDSDIKQRLHAVKFGLNYRFGSGPVVARY